MHRCALFSLAAALALPAFVAQAQVQRAFPQNALRGEVQFGQPPEALLNGQPARLAPGSRIRDGNNMLVMSGTLIGAKLMAHYTLDDYGLLKDVWIVRQDELAKIWPKNRQEAAAWTFYPAAQVWIKP